MARTADLETAERDVAAFRASVEALKAAVARTNGGHREGN
jgi:hypothetical protein